ATTRQFVFGTRPPAKRSAPAWGIGAPSLLWPGRPMARPLPRQAMTSQFDFGTDHRQTELLLFGASKLCPLGSVVAGWQNACVGESGQHCAFLGYGDRQEEALLLGTRGRRDCRGLVAARQHTGLGEP